MKGQFGLTTLIIFIALIVTAAVAAGVIIYTTQTMQQQALQTGAQAKQRVSTGIEAVRVFGYQYNIGTDSLDPRLQQISAIAPVVRLMSGSNPINFRDITILLTTDRGKFYSVSLKTHIPMALHGRLEGGKIQVTGFIYNNRVDIKSVPEYIIENSTICSDLSNNIYIISNSSSAPCYVMLNESNIVEPLPIEEVFKMLEEMKEYNVDTPSMLVALSLKDENVYLDSGEIYEWIMLLKESLTPEERYTLQILPKDGYATQVDGIVPTVLQSIVEDIWAK